MFVGFVARGNGEVGEFPFGAFEPGKAEELGGYAVGEEAGAEYFIDAGEEGVVGDQGAYDVEDDVFRHCCLEDGEEYRYGMYSLVL